MYDKGTLIADKKPAAAKTTAEIATGFSIFAVTTPVVSPIVSAPVVTDRTFSDGRSNRKADLCI